MAEQDSDKTEEPTAKRLTEAREKGQVARSVDLNSALILLAATSVLWFWCDTLADATLDIIMECLMAIPNYEALPGNLVAHARQGFILLLIMVLPMLLTSALVGVTANVSQFGFLFSTKALAPKFAKIFGLQGLKKMFSMNSLVELIKSLFKMGIVGAVGASVVHARYEECLAAIDTGLNNFVRLLRDVSLEILVKCSLVLLLLGIIDLFYQRWKHNKDLKMTKQEVKDESRSTDGDPHIKGKIRNLRMQMHRKFMMQEVPKATVVITNPTFIAIALRYEQGIDEAPVVVGKGKRLIAEKIRDTAKERGIPVIEDKPLARGLYDIAEVGQQIPPEFFGAIAEVLAYVFSLKGSTARV